MLDVSVEQINDLLPQTQCTQCGFEGCLPYAQSIASGQSNINRCPPGGDQTISSLSKLLQVPIIALDSSCGKTVPRHIANIDPVHCIGCTLCITACPVDAIVGANKRRHAVIASLCTGCELCIPPCPVDCIDMLFIEKHAHWNTSMAHEARTRMHDKKQRVVRQAQANTQRLESKAVHKLDELNQQTNTVEVNKKKSIIEAALERARNKRKIQENEQSQTD